MWRGNPARLPSRRRRGAVLTVLAVLVLLSAGCSALGTPEPPSGETAAERFTALDSYSGTIEVSYAGATTARNRTAEITVRPSTGESRIEVHEPARDAGNVYVYNRTRVIRYNATEGSVIRTELRGTNRTARVRERLRTFFDRVRGDDDGDDQVGVSPLPVVPGAEPSATAADAGRLVYRYAGTETVLGRQTHVVRVRSANATGSGVLNRTLWIDAEWFVTLRARTVRQVDDRRVTHTMRFTDIEFGVGVSEGTFTFDPPAEATVTRTARTRSQFDSRARLAAATDLSVPDPDIPEGFELERASHTVGPDRTELGLYYRRGTERLFVQKTTGDHEGLPDGERVSVGDRTGRYTEYGTGARVIWTCDGGRYAVYGSPGRGTLLDVARSVECE
jgi:outer membrane lipoprotein-sorting protein